MIPYKNRFHGHGGVRYVAKNGDAVRGRYLSIKHTASQNERSKTRLAVVVSKKVLKSAVGRNRIRRRLYEQLRLRIPDMKQGVSVVCFVASNEVKVLPTNELVGELDRILREAGLYKTSLKSDRIEKRENNA